MQSTLSVKTTTEGSRETFPARLSLTRPEPLWAPVVIRLATRGDQPALERLAQLDSTRPPNGETVMGELAGQLVAAVSVGDGTTIADPFVAGREIVELVRLRAEQLASRAPYHAISRGRKVR